MAKDRILTLHPEGKQGVHILRRRYDHVNLVRILREEGEITYQRLNDLAKTALKDRLDGSIAWYVVTVKLDLEARGIIKRVARSRPQRLRLADAALRCSPQNDKYH